MHDTFSPRDLLPFLGITFAVSWGVPAAGLLLVLAFPSFPFSLEINTPFYYLAVWGPAIGAIAVVAMRTGRRGVGSFLGRLLDWRLGGWWLFALVGIPSMFLLGTLIEHARGTPDALRWYDGSWLALALAFLLRGTAGPVEELGWRGFALPLLQRRISPWAAVFVIAALHTVWHVPAFLVAFASETHFGSELPLHVAVGRFAIGVFLITILMNVAYNATGGLVASAFLIHWMLNGIYPWEGDADVMFGQNVAIAAGALILLLVAGRRGLARQHAPTWILPGAR